MDFFRITKEEAISCVGEVVYVHNFSQNDSPAFLLGESAKIKIKLPRRLCASEVMVEIFDESGKNLLLSLGAVWCSLVGQYDEYTIKLPKHSLSVGLYFYRIKITSLIGTVYGTKNRDKLCFTDDPTPRIQLSVSDFIYNEPENLYGGIIYHVFVDRFSKGKAKKNKEGTVSVEDWYSEIPEYPPYPGAPLKNNYFYGGDLYGIINKLDYLSSLGVSAIYLSPIFESVSNHKYDTADYMQVDSAFGGDKALKALIKDAKEYGIGIILDGVFNHTGDDSLYFDKYGKYGFRGAYSDPDSAFRNWYKFRKYPEEYESWWGITILPRLDHSSESCRRFFTDEQSGVCARYVRAGIGGWRLDVADELSDQFLDELRVAVKGASDGEAIIIGEVWENAAEKVAYSQRRRYLRGAQLDSVMNYPLRNGVLAFLVDKDAEMLADILKSIYASYPKCVCDSLMNLLGTHDTERILTLLGDAGEDVSELSCRELEQKRLSDAQRASGITLQKLAAVIQYTVYGVPSVFYGDEAGVEGYGDPFCRRTFPWGRECVELLEHYTRLGNIREAEKLFVDGEFCVEHASGAFIAYRRYNESEQLTVVVNASDAPVSYSVSHKAVDLITGAEYSGVVPPLTALILK